MNPSTEDAPSVAPGGEADDAAARARLRRVAVQVMVLQVISLLLLWLLQSHFGNG